MWFAKPKNQNLLRWSLKRRDSDENIKNCDQNLLRWSLKRGNVDTNFDVFLPLEFTPLEFETKQIYGNTDQDEV